jgi:hypothetical protein
MQVRVHRATSGSIFRLALSLPHREGGKVDGKWPTWEETDGSMGRHLDFSRGCICHHSQRVAPNLP